MLKHILLSLSLSLSLSLFFSFFLLLKKKQTNKFAIGNFKIHYLSIVVVRVNSEFQYLIVDFDFAIV